MKMVIVSLDALFDADLAQLTEETFLGQFLSKASGCRHVRTVYPALTYPAHTTLVTGCDPAGHGIGQNQPHHPELEAKMRPWYWDANEVRAESLFNAVKKQGGKCASVLWPVTGKSRSIRWNFPEVLALPGENQVMKMLRYGTPGWILHMEMKHGKERVSLREPHLSDYATILLKDVIAAKKPDLSCVHLVDLDDMRHHYGTFSKEAGEALHRLDGRVEQIWQTLRQTKGMEDAVLCLVSDHGQGDVDKTVVLGEKMKGQPFAGEVSVQSNGMSAYLFLTAEGERRVDEIAAWLNENKESLCVKHVYEEQELRSIGAVAGVHLAVEAAEGVVFADGLPQAKREKATHGFGPGHKAENCLFALRGPGIREGVWLNDMPMRDVAPTVAGLMGLKLKDAAGVDHSESFRR